MDDSFDNSANCKLGGLCSWDFICNQQWIPVMHGPLFGKLFFSLWVIVHVYPFLKGLMPNPPCPPPPPNHCGGVWSIFSLLSVRIDPFTTKLSYWSRCSKVYVESTADDDEDRGVKRKEIMYFVIIVLL